MSDLYAAAYCGTDRCQVFFQALSSFRASTHAPSSMCTPAATFCVCCDSLVSPKPRSTRALSIWGTRRSPRSLAAECRFLNDQSFLTEWAGSPGGIWLALHGATCDLEWSASFNDSPTHHGGFTREAHRQS